MEDLTPISHALISGITKQQGNRDRTAVQRARLIANSNLTEQSETTILGNVVRPLHYIILAYCLAAWYIQTDLTYCKYVLHMDT